MRTDAVTVGRSGRQRSKLRVLLVEDEMMVALLLETMVEELGHEIAGLVAHLEKGLAMAQREALDLAILDVNLNGKEVYPIAAALAARGIPFIFATGYGRASVHASYRDRPTLQKPYRANDLRAAIAEACGGQ